MSDKRFGYGETDLFEWVEDNGEMISTKECVNKLNEQQDIITEQKEKVARVLNKYSRQFKRHSKEFSFMLDLAEDLGVKSLEAKDE